MRAVRCADSLFSRLDGYSGQSGQIQNAQNPARMIKGTLQLAEDSFLYSPELTAGFVALNLL